MVKMDNEADKVLGKVSKCIQMPLDVVSETDINLNTTPAVAAQGRDVVKQLSKNQRRRLRRKKAKAVQKANDQPKKSENEQDILLQKTDKTCHVKNRGHINEVEVGKVYETHYKRSPVRAPIPPTPLPAIKYKTIIASIQKATSKIGKKIFCIKNPCTPQLSICLANHFCSEIEMMQLRLKLTDSLNALNVDDELIIAKIVIDDNQNITRHVFEFIRTDLVGWIGIYQEEGLKTPIFHSMTNDISHITVVCDNVNAYTCLEQCIKDIDNLNTMGPIKVQRMPTLTLIYCFDAVYEGITRDPKLFLTQIHLHKSKLYSGNWIVVSHEVYLQESKTYFIFLIDGRSASALEIYYNNKLFICLHQVTFINRGIVTG